MNTYDIIARWRDSPQFHSDYLFLTEKIKSFGVALSLTGDYIDRETLKCLHKNHIKCLLKNEYKNAKRPLTGKALDIIIDKFLSALVKATNNMPQNEYPEMFVDCEYNEKDFI